MQSWVLSVRERSLLGATDRSAYWHAIERDLPTRHSDIREIEGIHCITVSEQSLDGSCDKALKTVASERLIPIHPMLTSCGLLAYVSECRHSGRTKLLEEIDPWPRVKRAVAFSKWFTQFTRACGAYQPRTSFHSFRHNFRDELRAARIDHEIAMELGGWTTGGGSRAASENYGSGHKVSALSDAIDRAPCHGATLLSQFPYFLGFSIEAQYWVAKPT